MTRHLLSCVFLAGHRIGRIQEVQNFKSLLRTSAVHEAVYSKRICLTSDCFYTSRHFCIYCVILKTHNCDFTLNVNKVIYHRPRRTLLSSSTSNSGQVWHIHVLDEPCLSWPVPLRCIVFGDPLCPDAS